MKPNLNNKFIIICSVFNVEKTIERCLSSILNQQYLNFELRVFNDGSSDRTLDIINSLVRPQDLVLSSKTNTRNKQHNVLLCLNESKIDDEDIIVTMDGDDKFMHNQVLNVLNSYYSCKNKLGMTAGQETEIDRTKVRMGVGLSNPYMYKFQQPHTFKYKILKKTNYLKNDSGHYFNIGEDVLRFYSALQTCISLGYGCLRLPHVLVEIDNSHDNNSTKTWGEEYYKQTEQVWKLASELFGDLDFYNKITDYIC